MGPPPASSTKCIWISLDLGMWTSEPQEARKAGQGTLRTPLLPRDLERFAGSGRIQGHPGEREREVRTGAQTRRRERPSISGEPWRPRSLPWRCAGSTAKAMPVSLASYWPATTWLLSCEPYESLYKRLSACTIRRSLVLLVLHRAHGPHRLTRHRQAPPAPP